MIALAAAAFVAIFFFDVPVPADRPRGRADRPRREPAPGCLPSAQAAATSGRRARRSRMPRRALGEATPAHARPALARVAARGGRLPAALARRRSGAARWRSAATTSSRKIAVFFSKMAVVTFGGAYAVLAYVAQQAVETYGWLEPGEMLDGLGMAETTPGPLIMVAAVRRLPGRLSRSGHAAADAGRHARRRCSPPG